MTDSGLETAAFLIFLGLFLNGCMGAMNRVHISEGEIVDEKVIADGMAEAACYMNGRNWKYGECEYD